jgi:pyridoxamine 5'-phosphate oxidase
MDTPTLSDDPLAVFAGWLEDARAAEINDPNAMALATVDASQTPDVRMVLMKGFDERGVVFYTNLDSVKAHELAAAPRAALLFHWKSLRRQVRIRGGVSAVAETEADGYFATRPRDSQIGAWASLQSRPLDRRETLEGRIAAFEAEFAGREVARPPRWSGFRLNPESWEFWSDGAFRLHDRQVFNKRESAPGFERLRLYP